MDFDNGNGSACLVPAGEQAAGWADLAETISTCARLLRTVVAGRAAEQGISDSQFSLLWACRAAPPGGLSQNRIAAALAVSPALVSGLVEQLRQAGHLESRRGLSDRRRQLWQLTARGWEVLRAISAELPDWVQPWENRIGVKGAAASVGALRALAEVLTDGPGGLS